MYCKGMQSPNSRHIVLDRFMTERHAHNLIENENENYRKFSNILSLLPRHR
jgi:predicted transposase YbfD/YdcC